MLRYYNNDVSVGRPWWPCLAAAAIGSSKALRRSGKVYKNQVLWPMTSWPVEGSLGEAGSN